MLYFYHENASRVCLILLGMLGLTFGNIYFSFICLKGLIQFIASHVKRTRSMMIVNQFDHIFNGLNLLLFQYK